MSRRDYVRIAGALREALQSSPRGEGKEGVILAIEYLSQSLREENPRFNTQRFLDACGVPGWEQSFRERKLSLVRCLHCRGN